MIVIDGDSVALATRASVYPHQTWWGLLPDKTIVLATPQATMEQCFERLPIVLSAKPDNYILMVGQWSHNHEPLETFARKLNDTVTELTKNGINVILVTPIYTTQKFEPFDVIPFVDAIRAAAEKFSESGVRLIDLYKIIKEYDILDAYGLHLGVAGNKLLAEHITDIFNEGR